MKQERLWKLGLKTQASETTGAYILRFNNRRVIDIPDNRGAGAGVVRHLVETRQPGSIVNVLSMVVHCGQSYLSAYSTSKGALATLTKNVANAFAANHIRCNGILTGWMDTPGESATQQKFHGVGEDWLAKAEATQPMAQLVKPHQVAGLAAYLLSPESGVMTGALIDYRIGW